MSDLLSRKERFSTWVFGRIVGFVICAVLMTTGLILTIHRNIGELSSLELAVFVGLYTMVMTVLCGLFVTFFRKRKIKKLSSYCSVLAFTRKYASILFLTMLFSITVLPIQQTVYAQETPRKKWVNRYNFEATQYNGTHAVTTVTCHIGPQVFWDNETNDWRELKFTYDTAKKYYLLQNSHMALRVFEDKTSSYYDPDNQRMCVEKEIVTVEWDNKGKWQLVDLKNPIFTINRNESSGVSLTKTLSGTNGVLNITYVLNVASFLKHDIVFKSSFSDNKTFRVHFRLEGVPSLKVKYPQGEESITSTKSIGEQFCFMLGENDTNLVLTEYLWSLGAMDETSGKWVSKTLRDVILDVENGKGKADIVIGNYTLAEKEQLEIDPTSSTFEVNNDYNDAYEQGDGEFFVWPDAFVLIQSNPTPTSEYYSCGGVSFSNFTVPQGAVIQETIFSSYTDSALYDYANLDIYGNDVDNAENFNTNQHIISTTYRLRTSASDSWVEDGIVEDDWNNHTFSTTIVKEIVDRSGWSSGNAIALLFIGKTNIAKKWRFYTLEAGTGQYPAKLYVTYTTENVAPVMGAFGAPETVYATHYSFVNETISDENGLTDFANATIELSGSIILLWTESPSVFSEYSDNNNYCTLDATNSIKTAINSTAYRLSWKVKFAYNYSFVSVSVIADNTKVYDDSGESDFGSQSDLFTFISVGSDAQIVAGETVAEGSSYSFTYSFSNGLTSEVSVAWCYFYIERGGTILDSFNTTNFSIGSLEEFEFQRAPSTSGMGVGVATLHTQTYAQGSEVLLCSDSHDFEITSGGGDESGGSSGGWTYDKTTKEPEFIPTPVGEVKTEVVSKTMTWICIGFGVMILWGIKNAIQRTRRRRR